MEYQKQLESRNSSYKLDEKSAQFYEELRLKDQQKENDRKREERDEMQRYKGLRLKKEESGGSPKGPVATKVDIARSIAVKKRKTAPQDAQKGEKGTKNNAKEVNSDVVKGSDVYGEKKAPETEEKAESVPGGLLSGYSSSDDE